MNVDRWEETKSALDAVLTQKPDKRQGFLQRLCRHDPELLAEVRSLLSAYDDDYLEQPVAPLALTALSKSPPPPETIGRYRIVKRLGAGGMGEVYQVVDPEGEPFAVKRLLRPFATEGELRRLRREAKAAAALEHPNIVRFIELIEHKGAPIIVMEFLDGKTLDRILERGRRLDLHMSLKVAGQVAKGLSCAHERSIVHRDIKPDNIILNRSGVVKILDFGIAKLLEALDQSETKGDSLTKSGDILGTAGFMSPEQAEGKKVDARADVFSFGCVLYRMLSGQDAFQGTSAIEKRIAILRGTPAPLDRDRLSLPEELDQLIMRCLHKDPNQRPASGSELSAALEAIERTH